MAEEATKTEGDPVNPPAEPTEEKTVGEVIEENTKKESDGKKPDAPEMVPLSSLLEFKNENKDLKKAIKELETKVNKGESSKDDIADDLDDLADKFSIEPKFVKELTKILEARAEKKADAKIKPILERDATLTKKEQDEKIDKAFKEHYAAALEKMPEYSEIANADAIKALSLLPQNASKTFAQLIEDTYGKAISGKRTIEPNTPGGGKDPESIDYDRVKNDTKYFEQIMANPVLKKEYNENMLKPRGRRS